MTSPDSVLRAAYEQAQRPPLSTLSEAQRAWLMPLVDHAEDQKGVLAALITSLTKKIVDPAQDIRYHKAELPGGYSGRGFDTRYVTPFLRTHFPRFAMTESGWLTRSLEQVHPFTKDFPGKIRQASVKTAFLAILHDLQENTADPEAYLVDLLRILHQRADADRPLVSQTPVFPRLTVAAISDRLHDHVSAPYGTSGASRLPVLALYAIYQCLLTSDRYRGKQLLPLKSHTTSDQKSATIGDIEIIDAAGDYFEAIEVKHAKAIDGMMVELALEKILARGASLNRFYLLTTHEPNTLDPLRITQRCQQIAAVHGVEIVVNGALATLRYYLRLLPEVEAFVMAYDALLKTEFERGGIKRARMQRWLDDDPRPRSSAL